jgi:hypothetical protein
MLFSRHTKRRDFITLLGCAAAAWPLVARAQQGERMRRIGVLMPLAADDPEGQTRLGAFLQGLQQLGWTVGRNLRVDHRWGAGNVGAMRKYATELVACARCAPQLASMYAQGRYKLASLFGFWIERPNALLPRHIAGTGHPLSFFSQSAARWKKRDFGRKRPELKFSGESSARASVCWPSDRLSSEGIFRRRAFALIYGHGQRSDVKVQVLCHFMSTFERRSFQVKPE